LPDPLFAHQRHHLAGLDCEIDAAQNRFFTIFEINVLEVNVGLVGLEWLGGLPGL